MHCRGFFQILTLSFILPLFNLYSLNIHFIEWYRSCICIWYRYSFFHIFYPNYFLSVTFWSLELDLLNFCNLFDCWSYMSNQTVTSHLILFWDIRFLVIIILCGFSIRWISATPLVTEVGYHSHLRYFIKFKLLFLIM